MKTIFKEYANYYNLIYQHKDYALEAEFVSKLIKKNRPTANSILDLGCGTGNHGQFLKKRGFDFYGVDQSQEMIKFAKEVMPDIAENFIVSSVGDLKLDKKFDVIISLFHVLCYQTRNSELISFFEAIEKHLETDGIAIIDYWYAPSVKHLGLEARVKEILNNNQKITRKVTPFEERGNVAQVGIELIVEENNQVISRIFEKHFMRYFYEEELKKLIPETLDIIENSAWLEENKKPTKDNWSAYLILKKKKTS